MSLFQTDLSTLANKYPKFSKKTSLSVHSNDEVVCQPQLKFDTNVRARKIAHLIL